MKLHDTLTGEKRDFAPQGEKVTMYVCGPNLYGPCHIGHALSYIVFDVLRRYLEHREYKVHHVQNFTDIEDRIIEVSQRDDTSIGELAERYRLESVEPAAELVAIADAAYQEGEYGILELLDAHRVTLGAETRLLELSAAARRAAIELDRVMGGEAGP